MNRKTYKEWQKSNLDLDKYLPEPCEIDEELALYIGECVPPVYLGPNGLCQGGDAQASVGKWPNDEVLTYMTVSNVNGKDFYLGILPEFKQ